MKKKTYQKPTTESTLHFHNSLKIKPLIPNGLAVFFVSSVPMFRGFD